MEENTLSDITKSPFHKYTRKEQLDVLVCGQCDTVFHNIGEFQEHREREIEQGTVANFLLWKNFLTENSQRDDTNDWILFNQWFGLQININNKDLNRAETAGVNIRNVDSNSNRTVPKKQDTLISTNRSPKDIQSFSVISNNNKKDKFDPELKSQKSNLSKDPNVFLKQSSIKVKSVEKSPTPIKKRLITDSPKNSSSSSKVQSWAIDVEQPGSSDNMTS